MSSFSTVRPTGSSTYSRYRPLAGFRMGDPCTKAEGVLGLVGELGHRQEFSAGN